MPGWTAPQRSEARTSNPATRDLWDCGVQRYRRSIPVFESDRAAS
jgi:hypothetical protein